MNPQKPNENKKITIYDIAEEAGVSAATVSRVLTNNAKVRKEKKDKVLAIIEKYQFKPNALARGLVDTKRNVIGIITADVRNPFYANLYVACEIAARELGYTVILCNSFGEMDEELRLLDMMQEQRVDAIIQFGGSVDDVETKKEYSAYINGVMSDIPVIVTGKVDDAECNAVQINAYRVIDLLMEHLVQLGHRKIALVGGRENVVSTNAKIKEYIHLHEVYGLDYKEEYIVSGNYIQETGYQGMEKLLELEDIPTAVIAINDFSASGIIRCLHDKGYRVPEDISVVSQDNTYIAEYMVPSLTSVDYNYEKFGRLLVETAINTKEKKEVIPLQRIDPYLVVRESSGRLK